MNHTVTCKYCYFRISSDIDAPEAYPAKVTIRCRHCGKINTIRGKDAEAFRRSLPRAKTRKVPQMLVRK